MSDGQSNLIEHEPIVERFVREKASGAWAETYLFVGNSRRRLREVAESCAASALDARGDVTEHADFVCFDPEELGVRALKVEHIATRRDGVESVAETLQYRPAAGAHRVVLLLDADRMGADAQAALLKTAEEPPPGTLIFMCASDLGGLLPALRSRCRTYRVSRPSAAALDARAATLAISDSDWDKLREATGSREAALELGTDERAWLLEQHAGFDRWRTGAGPAGAWLAAPEGSLAEQRARGRRLLAAGLGWLAAAYPQSKPAEALRLDRAAGHLAAAASDLEGQVTPGLVFQELRLRLDEAAYLA